MQPVSLPLRPASGKNQRISDFELLALCSLNETVADSRPLIACSSSVDDLVRLSPTNLVSQRSKRLLTATREDLFPPTPRLQPLRRREPAAFRPTHLQFRHRGGERGEKRDEDLCPLSALAPVLLGSSIEWRRCLSVGSGSSTTPETPTSTTSNPSTAHRTTTAPSSPVAKYRWKRIRVRRRAPCEPSVVSASGTSSSADTPCPSTISLHPFPIEPSFTT